MFTRTMKALLSASLILATSSACIVVTEGDGGGHGWGNTPPHPNPHSDNFDDWDEFDDEDDCFCDEFGEPCDVSDDHDGHDHEQPGEPAEPDEPVEEEDDCVVSMQVCGEDGVTYESPCAASRAHVYVDHEGPCGVPCIFDSECGVYQECGTQGICEDFSCDLEPMAQVCGEDGVTYDNSCEARAQHVLVAYEGECLPPCMQDTDCDLGSICNANRCEVADCPQLPEDDHSQEVCGVNTFTYTTACEARANHIEIVHEGCCVE